MVRIKFDVTGQDPEESVRGTSEQPKPGVYKAKLIQCKPGYAKGDDGKADRERPRMEVVMEIRDKKFKGARLYDYISMLEPSKWKQDQFLQAFGISTSKKRKGSFDPEKIIGDVINIRVSADSYGGEYRARLGGYLLDSGEEDFDDEDEDEEYEDDDDDEDYEEDDNDEEDDDEDDEEEDDDEDEDEDEDDDEIDLAALSFNELKALAKKEKVRVKQGSKGAGFRKALAEHFAEEEDEDDEEEEDEDDEEEAEPLTVKALKALSLKGLRTLGTEYGVDPLPKNKDKLVKAVKNAQDEYFDEEPF